MGNFEKTFVDQLLYNKGVDEGRGGGIGFSRESCDWMLSLMDPMTQIVGLLLFIPIQKYGYKHLYSIIFIINIILSISLLALNGISNNKDNNSQHSVLFVGLFLFCSSVLMNGMASSGFGLAMCDMVLEMKHKHLIVENRINAPSLAGMFMGVNALFCKPAESILPIITASFLSIGNSNNNNNSTISEGGDNDDNDAGDIGEDKDDYDKLILYRLLVFPPLICSMLQLIVWSKYSLVPKKTQKLRNDMEQYEKQQQQQQQQQPNNGPRSSNDYEQNDNEGYHDDDHDDDHDAGKEQEEQFSKNNSGIIEMHRII
jgi:Na+/melibiose symporter-like transporter